MNLRQMPVAESKRVFLGGVDGGVRKIGTLTEVFDSRQHIGCEVTIRCNFPLW